MKTGFDLLFDWPSRHVVHVGLPVALVASAGLHLAGIAAFGLATPRPSPASRQAATFYALSAAGDSGSQLARRTAAADPALFSPKTTEDPTLASLPTADYIPSFDTWRPRLAAAPDAAPLRSPPALQYELPSERRTPPPVEPLPDTSIVLGGELAGRAFLGAEPPGFTSDERDTLAPAEFLLAVARDGSVLHAVPIQSSGDEALDRAALRTLLEARLTEAATTAWGAAVFHWGADVKPAAQP